MPFVGFSRISLFDQLSSATSSVLAAMTSHVSVRSHHVKKEQSEQIHFTGNGIFLLDLKREILELKKIKPSHDFDFKIVDEYNKGV